MRKRTKTDLLAVLMCLALLMGLTALPAASAEPNWEQSVLDDSGVGTVTEDGTKATFSGTQSTKLLNMRNNDQDSGQFVGEVDQIVWAFTYAQPVSYSGFFADIEWDGFVKSETNYGKLALIFDFGGTKAQPLPTILENGVETPVTTSQKSVMFLFCPTEDGKIELRVYSIANRVVWETGAMRSGIFEDSDGVFSVSFGTRDILVNGVSICDIQGAVSAVSPDFSVDPYLTVVGLEKEGIAPDLTASVSFDHWKNATALGSRTVTAEGVNFSGTEQDHYLYANDASGGSLVFDFTNAQAYDWSTPHLWLRIDTLAEGSTYDGRIGLAFDFSGTSGLGYVHSINGVTNNAASEKSMILWIDLAGVDGKESIYEFSVGRSMSDRNTGFGVGNANEYTQPKEFPMKDGILEISLVGDYDFVVNGVSVQAQNIFQPGGQFNITPSEDPDPYLTIFGIDDTNASAQPLSVTLLDEEPSSIEELIGSWKQNSLKGSMSLSENGVPTFEGTSADETILLDNDDPRSTAFDQEINNILFSYTDTTPYLYNGSEVTVQINDITSDAGHSPKIGLIFSFTEEVPQNIFAQDGIFLILVGTETPNVFRPVIFRIIDRVIYEEFRGNNDFELITAVDGKLSFGFAGNNISLYNADGGAGEELVDISGLLTLAGYNIDTSGEVYLSVLGMDLEGQIQDVMSLTVSHEEAGEDPYLEEAADSSTDGKMEFVSTDWMTWEMSGTEVEYTVSEDGLRLSGKGGDYGQKQAMSYGRPLDLKAEDASFKVVFQLDQYYPYVTGEDGKTIKNTFDIIINTEYKMNFTARPSLFVRTTYNSDTEGHASVILNTGTTAETVIGLSELDFSVGTDRKVVVWVMRDDEGSMRVYVNGVRAVMSRSQTAQLNALFEDNGAMYLSTYSTAEKEYLDENGQIKAELDASLNPIYTITSIDGKAIVNEVPELTNVAAPAKPSEDEITKTSMTLTWSAPELNPYDRKSFSVGAYVIQRFDGNSKGSAADGTPDEVYYLTDLSLIENEDETFSYEITGLTEDTKYFFTIWAVLDGSDKELIFEDGNVLARYAQFTVTTAGDPEVTPPEDPDDNGGGCAGCSGTVSGTGMALLALAALGAAAIWKKRAH